jgi:hypothetical protein
MYSARNQPHASTSLNTVSFSGLRRLQRALPAVDAMSASATAQPRHAQKPRIAPTSCSSHATTPGSTATMNVAATT